MTRASSRAGRPGCLALSRREMARLQAHARRAYPEECCGVLVGRRGERTVVVSVHPAGNQRRERARDRYEIHPGEVLRLDRAAAREGLEIVGFYHSHPDHPTEPSLTDAEQAWPAYLYVIVAVSAGSETEVKAWTYDDTLGRFHEWRIEVEPERAALVGSGPSKAVTGR